VPVNQLQSIATVFRFHYIPFNFRLDTSPWGLKPMPLIISRQSLKRHVGAAMGRRSIRLACQLDLEGIVEKRADSRYEDNPNVRNWIKIKNPAYSQKEGRAGLLKRTG
jgi:hypothetical protein